MIRITVICDDRQLHCFSHQQLFLKHWQKWKVNIVQWKVFNLCPSWRFLVLLLFSVGWDMLEYNPDLCANVKKAVFDIIKWIDIYTFMLNDLLNFKSPPFSYYRVFTLSIYLTSSPHPPPPLFLPLFLPLPDPLLLCYTLLPGLLPQSAFSLFPFFHCTPESFPFSLSLSHPPPSPLTL